MEKYGDLITNGLDLISFLLVTPELIRFAQPAVRVVMILLTIGFLALCRFGDHSSKGGGKFLP